MILSVHIEQVIVRSLYLHAPAFKAKSDETPDECTAIARPTRGRRAEPMMMLQASRRIFQPLTTLHQDNSLVARPWTGRRMPGFFCDFMPAQM